MEKSKIISLIKNANSLSTKMLRKLNKFDTHELVFLGYLIILCIVVLFFRIAKIESSSTVIKIWSCPTILLIVLICLAFLILWNVSTKFKNIIQTYIGGRDNEALVNSILLLILSTVYYSIGDIVGELDAVTEITSRWFTKAWLLIGFVITLVSVVKNAKNNAKKTKIINIVDDERKQAESVKQEIKKGLFDPDDPDQN